MKTIERYDKTAKLLVTVVTPLQAALFAVYRQVAVYQQVGRESSDALPWFTKLLLIAFVISVAGVYASVTYVCRERPKLKIKLHGSESEEGVISSLLDGSVDMSNAVKSWEEHIEYAARCKHWWLMSAFWCFVAGSGAAVAGLIYIAF